MREEPRSHGVYLVFTLMLGNEKFELRVKPFIRIIQGTLLYGLPSVEGLDYLIESGRRIR